MPAPYRVPTNANLTLKFDVCEDGADRRITIMQMWDLSKAIMP